MSCPHEYNCPRCKDKLIHQNNRGPRESSSGFGQYVFNEIGHVMDLVDIDLVVFKRATRLLRIIEAKPPGGELGIAQCFVMPILALAIRILAGLGELHPNSGVYMLETAPPFATGVASRIGWTTLGTVAMGRPVQLVESYFRAFLQADPTGPLNDWPPTALAMQHHSQDGDSAPF
jgi:hypothetical protein